MVQSASRPAMAVNNWWRALEARFGAAGTKAVLFRGALGSFSMNISAAALGLAMQMLLARLLGAYHYGAYAYAASWLLLLTHSAKLGYDRTVIRYLSVYKAQEDWGAFRGMLRHAHAVVGTASLLAAGALALGVFLLRERIDETLAWTFFASAAVLPLLVLSGLRQGALQALRHVIQGQFPESMLRPLTIMLLCASVWWMGNRVLTAPTAMSMNLMATLAAFLLGSWWLRRRIPPESIGAPPKYSVREWFGMALPMMAIAGFGILMKRLDVLMIGYLVALPEAGFYSAAAQLTELTAFGLLAINAIAAPLIAELYASGKRGELQEVLRFAALGLTLFTVPAALILILAGKSVLGVYGGGFQAAYPALVILTLGQITNVSTGSVGFLLTMTGRQRLAMAIAALAAALNATLNLALIPLFGMTGGALATAISVATWNVVTYIVVRKRIGIDSSIFFALWKLWK